MRAHTTLMAACLLAAAGAAAAPGPDWQPVDAAVLAEARAGFESGGGLLMSLGVERLVTLNGNVVSSSAFSIAEGGRLGAGAPAATFSLLQNGAGNTFLAGPMSQALAATVIQNSLNNQVLGTRTVINATVNSLELLKAINFQGSLQTALSNAVGGR